MHPGMANNLDSNQKDLWVYTVCAQIRWSKNYYGKYNVSDSHLNEQGIYMPHIQFSSVANQTNR